MNDAWHLNFSFPKNVTGFDLKKLQCFVTVLGGGAGVKLIIAL